MNPDPAAAAEVMEGRSLWQDSWARLRRNRLAVVCMAVLGLVVLFCTAGPLFCHWSPRVTNLDLRAKAPGYVETLDRETWLRHRYDSDEARFRKALENGEGPEKSELRHWLGTDNLGRDLLARTMQGGRVSLMVAFIATLVALIIGVTYGAAAGYLGGRTDDAMMRLVEILRALPFLIFVILLTTMFGTELWLIYLAIGAIEWPTMARIVRTQVLGLARQEFVDAARSLGLSTPAILFRHIIPNVLGPVIVYATLTVPAVMLLEAGLSFLGLGVQPPASSWGTLISDGADHMESHPWLLAGPAAVFSLTLFCLNFAGDGLRDAMDVRTAKD
jgi:oligopeptide transport system permease protein